MATLALTGSDTIMINNKPLADLADGNCAELTYPNDIASVKTGKNGNSIFGLNETGKQGELKLRVIRGSADDKYLNGLYSSQQANFSGTVLLIGQFIKKLGDGLGNITNDTYIAQSGIFSKGIEAKTNVEGEAEQSVAVYTLKFANVVRVLT